MRGLGDAGGGGEGPPKVPPPLPRVSGRLWDLLGLGVGVLVGWV